MAATETLAIYGTGGHGKVVAQIARSLGARNIVWIDDRELPGTIRFETYLQGEHYPIALGIGSNHARKKVFETLKGAGLEVVTLIHPTAIIADDARIGEGSIVMPFVAVNAEAAVAEGAILNTHTVVEHECRIAPFVHLSPRVALGGAVTVGEQTHLGIGSSVIQCLSLGAHCVIGAGAAVVRDLPDRVLAVGVPAKIIKEYP